MSKRIIPFALSFFFTIGLMAQIPTKAIIEASDGHTATTGKRAPCTGNDAGIVTLGSIRNTTGESVSNSNPTDDPIFLCFKNDLMVLNGGATTDGDPNQATQGGIGYAFYADRPTVDGDNYTAILADPFMLRDMDPSTDPDSLFIFVDPNDPSGQSVTFLNDTLLPGGQGLNDFFFGGVPTPIWFAPITYDNLSTNGAAKYENDGSCVTVGVNEAFSVVYLNPIEIINEQYPFGGNGSEARLNIKGGLPEFDTNEFYNISIRKADDPSVVGEVVGSDPVGNRDFPVIRVPQPGTYTVTFSDGQSCSLVHTIVMEDFDNERSLTLISTDNAGVVGGEICIDIQVEDFDSIVGAGFFIGWDTAVLDFRGVTTLLMDGTENNWAYGENLSDDGVLIVNYLSQDFDSGTMYPDGTSLFQVCFTAKAEGMVSVDFVDDPRSNNSSTEIIHADGSLVSIINEEPGTITVNDPNRITVIIPSDGVKDACPGEDNGSITIQATGGTAPYEVFLINVDNGTLIGPADISEENGSVTISSVPPGVYNYEVTDSGIGADKKFSTSADPVEIVITNLLADGGVVDAVTCNGDNDGSMGVTVFKNGVTLTDLSDYSFNWVNADGDTVSTDEIATNLVAGPYTVFVSDPNGCMADNTSPLPQTNPLAITINKTDPSCSGVEDGGIQITMVDGGQAPFSYEWSNGDDDENNLSIEEGKYLFTVTDANGCAKTDSTELMATISITTPQQATTPVLCFGADNGTITLQAGYAGPANSIPSANGYVFDWSPDSPVNTETGNRSLLSDLPPATYSVLITHPELPNGCETTRDFIITEPDSLIIASIDITNVSSCTLEDGSATAIASGGTIAADYNYTWMTNDPMDNPQNGATATSLAADTITVTVEDDNGCITMLDTVIGTPPPPIITSFRSDSVNCFNDVDGFLQVVATRDPNGAAISTYTWSHDNSITGQTAGTLSPGTYFVTVTDADQCTSIDSAIVFAPERINIDTVIFSEPCFGADDGRISVNVSGGVPQAGANPYAFDWSNGDNGSVLTGIEAGGYDLAITDANNCVLDTGIMLNNLLRIIVDFDPASIDGVDCFDNINPADCDGAALATAVYEDGSAGSFDFTWQNTNEFVAGTDQFSSSSLCAGMQAIMVSDGQCDAIDSVLIPSPTQLLFDPVNSVIDPTRCFGEANGQATVAATGGTPGYSFDWPGNISGATVTDFEAGTYTLTITDANNCIRTHDIEISQPDELLVGLDLDNTNDVVCEGDLNGRIAVIVTGGNQGTPNFVWTDNVSNGPTAAGLSPGTYVINVTDINGCMGSTQYTVAQPPALSGTVDFTDIQCFGLQSVISVNNPQGGNGGSYTFSVDNSPPQPVDVVIPVFGGDHLVSIFDAEGCQEDFDIEIFEPAELMVTFPENVVEVDLGSMITLTPDIISSVPIADLQWTANGGSLDSSFVCNSVLCDNPTVNPLDNISYTLMATDQNGCFAEGRVIVDVDKNRNVYIPNVFAPNGTGFDTNDRFQIFTGSGVQRINFARVFNRWGTLVAEIEDIDPSSAGITIWDGSHKGQKANQGVYIYIIEVEFIDRQPDGSNTKLLYRGDISLLR